MLGWPRVIQREARLLFCLGFSKEIDLGYESAAGVG